MKNIHINLRQQPTSVVAVDSDTARVYFFNRLLLRLPRASKSFGVVRDDPYEAVFLWYLMGRIGSWEGVTS